MTTRFLRKHAIVALAVAAVTAVTASAARAAEWSLLESEHFSLYARGDEAAAREYLKQMEGFRWLALKVLGTGARSLRAQARFDIYLMPGTDALRALYPELPNNAAGVYHHCSEGSVAHGAFSVRWRTSQDYNQVVLLHEYAHHLMFQHATASYPAWFVEGFAEYMATTEYEGERVSLGAVHETRSRDLAHPSWLPFDDVLRWDGSLPKNDRNLGPSLYAQSWLLTHYMLSDDERSKKLTAYIAAQGAGEEPVAAFERVTGIAPATLPRLLQRYLRDGLPMLKVGGQDLPRPAVTATPLGADADDYLPAASALQACVSDEQGQAFLARLRTLAPRPAQANPRLRLALARAEARFGDPKAAIDMLEAHLAADAESAEAHYLLGRAWGRQAQALEGDAQQAAREGERTHLIKAYRLRKDHAPTLYHLARALERKGIDNNVLNAARAARLLSPSVGEYAVFEAWLDLQAGERDQAARALAPLASDPHAPARAARMRQAIEAIHAGKTMREVSALMNGSATNTEP